MITEYLLRYQKQGFALLVLALLASPQGWLTAQCLFPELAMLNSCIEHDNPNLSSIPVEGEILIVRSGLVAVPVDSIGFDLPFNGFGPQNGDIGFDIDGTPFPCGFKVPTVTALSGCPGAIPLGPDDVIPPGALVVLFITGTTETADAADTDFSNICLNGQPVYILQNACERTAGAFANGPGSGDPFRTITTSSPCGLRAFTYNTQDLNPNDGTYFQVGLGQPGNLDCDFPIIPATCPPLDTVLGLCGYGAMVDPPVSTDLFRELYPSSILSVSFHRSPGEAELDVNRLTEYTGPTNTSDTLYVRLVLADNFCVTVGRLYFNFSADVNVATVPAEPIRGCDPELDGTGTFNLNLQDAEVGGGAPVRWFTDAGATMPVVDPANFVSSATTIYAVAGLGTCQGTPVAIPLELIAGPEGRADISATSCPGNNDGRIAVSATGFGPFTYDWGNDDFFNQPVRTGLAATQYRITVTDQYGCEDRLRPTVPEGGPLLLACSVVQTASDPAASDGVARLVFSGGNPPFQLNYSGAAAGAMQVDQAMIDLPGLRPGTYTFVATDADGCTSAPCTLEIPANPPISLQCSVRNNSDGGTILGSIEITLDGGLEPFQITLTDGNGGSSNFPNRMRGNHVFPGLPAGTYTITVTDATGRSENCTSTIIIDACPLVIAGVRLLAADCSGDGNSIIRLTIAGNDGAISTVWTGDNNVGIFDGQQDAGPLPPGTYFVSVTDQSGCPAVTSGPITVTTPGTVSYQLSGNFVTTACRDDGTVNVEFLGGGAGPYTAVLVDNNSGTFLERSTSRPAGSTVTFSGLSGQPGAPAYGIIVEDANGCLADQTMLNITAAPVPTLSLPAADQIVQPPGCPGGSDGSLAIAASGGTPPYTYRWIDYPGLTDGVILPPGNNQDNLMAGDYLIEITDGNGCLDSARLTLPDGQSPSIVCGPTTAASAAGPGTATFNLTGGLAPYTIILNLNGTDEAYPGLASGSNTITDLVAGDYRAIVADANGCRTAGCLLTVDSVFCNLGLTAVVDSISCGGSEPGAISVIPTGGAGPFVFDWQDPALPDQSAVTIDNAGSYAIRLTDAAGCSLDTTFSVAVRNNLPTVTFEASRQLTACFPDSIGIPLVLTGAGSIELGYAISYDGGIPVPDLLTSSAGADTVWVSFANSATGSVAVFFGTLEDGDCQNTVQEIFQLEQLQPDTVRRNDVTCDPGPINIGGRFFDETFPADTFLVDDSSPCGVVYAVALTFNAPSIPDTSIVFTCPATPYEENGQVFDANRPEGEVVYTRPGLCDSIVYVRLDIASTNLGSYGESVCVGDTIFYGDRVFTAENPDGLARFPGLAANGCDSLVVVNNNFRRTGELRLFGDFAICPGDSIELRFAYDGPGGINAVLTDDAGNLTQLNDVRQGSRVELFPTVSTNYRLISASIGGCPGEVRGTSSVVVNDLTAVAEVLVDPGDFCRDTLGRAVVTYQGGVAPYAVAWSNGPVDSINRNLLAGAYAVTVTDAAGCTVVDSVRLHPREPLTARVTGLPPVCPGEDGRLQIDTVFGGGGFYEVSLDGIFFLSVANVGDFRVPPGLARATFQDADDCTTTVTFFVPGTNETSFNLPADTTIFLGDSLLLDPRIVLPLDTAWWSPPLGLSTPGQLSTIAAPLSSSNYTLHLRTAAQCDFTQTVSITVDERLPVYVPTAFHPDGDGVNDVFRLEYNGRVTEVKTFQVFNRWGTLVHDGAEGWDGQLNGRPAQVGVYVYQAVVVLTDGSERLLKGDVVLMR